MCVVGVAYVQRPGNVSVSTCLVNKLANICATCICRMCTCNARVLDTKCATYAPGTARSSDLVSRTPTSSSCWQTTRPAILAINSLAVSMPTREGTSICMETTSRWTTEGTRLRWRTSCASSQVCPCTLLLSDSCLILDHERGRSCGALRPAV